MFEIFKKDEGLDNIDKLLGGIFGIIAILASVIEMILRDFTTEAIVSTIKDVSSVAVVVVLLVAFMKNLPKTPKNIRDSIEKEMVKIEKAYSPLIRKVEAQDEDNEAKKNKLEKTIRYEIADDVNALFDVKSTYHRFFDIQDEHPTEIKFAIRKAFFGDSPERPYEPDKISKHLMGYMKKNHGECTMNYVPDKDGGFVVLYFKGPIETDKEIDDLITIVDDMLFAYVAENKKG